MRNNRQVGLDGKVFLTSCLKRSSIYVIGVILFGIINAVADVMKLTGKSGAAMSSLTSTLVSLDLIVSLMFVVVVFYAYFLECGSSIPVLREKPLIILGYCRLAYNVLLCYYIIYRAMYCIVNGGKVPFGVLAFYFVYMIVTFMSILVCCFIINVISRNMIRRVYIRSLRNMAVVGIVFTALTSIMYIIARFWIGDIGDEFFTGAFCDLLRLCIAPIFYLCVWVVLLKARTVTSEVFGEVDAAIRDRRYQITYTDKSKETEEKGESKKLKNSKAKAASAAATVAAIEAQIAQQALPEAKKPAEEIPAKEPEKRDEKESAPASAEAIYPQQVITENTVKTRESKIKDEKLRKAVSEAVEKAIREDEALADAQIDTQNKSQKPAAQSKMPVMDFDPYAQAERAQPRVRPNQPNGGNKKPAQNMQQRPVNPQNRNRPQQNLQQRPQNNGQQRKIQPQSQGSNAHRSTQQRNAPQQRPQRQGQNYNQRKK